MKFIIALLVFAIAMVAFAKDLPKPSPTPAKVVKAEVKKDKVKVDKPLSAAELAEVQAWVAGKVKSKDMTQKQADDALKHPEALKKVVDSEKKPKKGVKKNGN